MATPAGPLWPHFSSHCSIVCGFPASVISPAAHPSARSEDWLGIPRWFLKRLSDAAAGAETRRSTWEPMEPVTGDIHNTGQHINIGVISSNVVGMGLAKLRSPVQVLQYTRWVPRGSLWRAQQCRLRQRAELLVCRRGCAVAVQLPQHTSHYRRVTVLYMKDCRRVPQTAADLCEPHSRNCGTFTPTAAATAVYIKLAHVRHNSINDVKAGSFTSNETNNLAEAEYDASGVVNILSAAAQPQMHICGTANLEATPAITAAFLYRTYGFVDRRSQPAFLGYTWTVTSGYSFTSLSLPVPGMSCYSGRRCLRVGHWRGFSRLPIGPSQSREPVRYTPSILNKLT
ncbi:hypothetical protein GGX14DRAFT_620755 [Mycena pura]|uniref:Uncharacterized protein n=1 Tax=Mycena pura TaxID=153505 RepID=A0AAD6VGW6_9AGAR|nr:hypothetical protein GGX14DRAFT_620755 [Mycena pura]